MTTYRGFLVWCYILVTVACSASILLAILLLVSVFSRIEIPRFTKLPLILISISIHLAFWLNGIIFIGANWDDTDDPGVALAKLSPLFVLFYASAAELIYCCLVYRGSQDQFSMEIRKDKGLARILGDLAGL